MSTQHIVMPGTAGNYISTEDVNLFPDADSANLEQSIGEWIRLSNVDSPLVIASALTPTFGTSYLECAATGTVGAGSGSSIGFGYAAPYIDADPATAYQATFAAACDTAGYEIAAFFYFLSSGGSIISNVNDTFALTSAFQTFELDLGVSPALTDRIRILLEVRKVGDQGIVAGVKYQIDAFCIREGSDATFVPSLAIVGDLDLRAKVAADDWTPAAASYILTNLSGFTGYQLFVNTSGELVSRYGDGSSTRSEGTTALGFTDGSAHVVSVEWDESAGTLEWFADGASIGTDSYSAGPGVPSTSDLLVGSGFDGDVYYVEVRDGIDGPIVARMDATDAAGVS